jgi:hypothetical protein
LLFPAFVPAVKAGLRLLRASGRESLRAPPLARGSAPFLEALPLREAVALRKVLPPREFALGLPAAVLEPLLWPLRWGHD